MSIFLRLIITFVGLYIYFNLMLSDINDKNNAITHKMYIFLFVFFLQFFIYFFSLIIQKNSKIYVGQIIETSMNNAILAVIAFDVYGDLYYTNHFVGLTQQQQILILVLFIIGFMTIIKILQLLLTNN